MSPTAELGPVDVGWREAAVHAAVDQAGLDALIVTSPSNIRWLTGFAGSAATVAVTADRLLFVTDSRYAERAPTELAAVNSQAAVVVNRTVAEELKPWLGSARRVGLEAEHVTWAARDRIAAEWLPDAELVATNDVVDELRSVKDQAEIDRIQTAAAIVDRALGQVRGLLDQRPSEAQFGAALDAAIRAGGADDLGFDTIVASGPNGAIAHHSPGDRNISTGDLVIVDVGARVDGYRSDMTRTFSVGPMSTHGARVFDTVVAAQQAGVAAMAAGIATKAVDQAARDVIDRAGWGNEFSHGTGHGVGLDIHELPTVNAKSEFSYAEGTVATVEPGIYLSGFGGVRIEDTCVAGPAGPARRLTAFPKDPE